MSKVYLIGGAPRVGKSTVAIRAVGVKPMFAIAGDSIRYIMRQLIDPKEQPALFACSDYAKDSEFSDNVFKDPGVLIDLQNKESEIVWPIINRMIEGYIEDGQDVVVEGVAILPKHLSELKYEYKSVFIGNIAPDHHEVIKEIARTNEHDWLNDHSDKSIEAYSYFFTEFSKYIQQEAARFGFPYVEISDQSFEADLEKTSKILLG